VFSSEVDTGSREENASNQGSGASMPHLKITRTRRNVTACCTRNMNWITAQDGTLIVISAYQQSAESADMPEWKPIDSAPTDGTWVKVRGWDFGIEGSRRHYAVAFYEGGVWLEVGGNGNQLRYLTDWQELTQQHNKPPATPSRSYGLIF
jgi:hypothetical protein